MNEEMNVQGTEQQTAADQTGRTGAATETGKTFTQEEVDKIVEKRLSRERKKYTSILNGEDPREVDLAERERNLAVRELQADAKGLLAEKKLPMEALELLNYADKESCVKSIDALEVIVKAAAQERIDGLLRGGPPIKKAPPMDEQSLSDPIRAAFRP